ncbi:TlpA disulfide reductase family protein [Idiomarina piscisalsi]|uniref:TlpA disulfide reductase family protein n=1 Tax=Idiomarina piscisalsi TaxID=1096243 RepID=UPI0013830714|nr:TlpA disulfide reductase family protein [Idiomarina piscisalsi]MTJ02848.1 TlpA family protein disulfide reductase [Idiomarina piscisalsi]
MKLAVIAFAASFLLLGCSEQANVTTDNGKNYDWSSMHGKTVVVNYFAEWCAPCLRELPELNEFHHQKPDNVELIGVSFDPMSNEDLAALKEKHGIEFPLVLTQPAPAFPFERPNMLPATYVIRSDGSVDGPLMGEQTLGSLKNAVGAE